MALVRLSTLACFLATVQPLASAWSDAELPEKRAPKPTPLYKNPKANIEDRVNDLLPRMTLEEKVAQLIQGDINGWTPNPNDPLDTTMSYNATGLVEMMKYKGGSIWAGYQMPYDKLAYTIEVGQRYLMENTTLGIPALIQSEGLHGYPNNGTIWPSPIGLAASFDPDLLKKAAATIADEAEGFGINQLFAPVLDLGRELRWGRVEEGFGEDPFLTGAMALAYVEGVQAGSRRNASSTAIARMAATCKHFAAFGSPQGGLNCAPVAGGERDLRSLYLPPFKKACLESLAIMTAYSSYDGVPAAGNNHLLVDILRKEWGYKYWVIDMLQTQHYVCDSRECAARLGVSQYQGEMGGGTYTYLTLVDQVKKGLISQSIIDQTVKYMLRTKFSLGLFENPYPYKDYKSKIRTPATLQLLKQMDEDQIVLLKNEGNTLPLSKSISSVAVIGPSAGQVLCSDYVFHGANLNGISPLDGFKKLLSGTNVKVNYAEGAKLWSNDESGFPDAVNAAKNSDAAVVVVGTWTRDQTELWGGLNATTGEHVDVSDLGLVGASLKLVQEIKATGKPTIVVFISGRPVSEPWIADHADAIVQQFYPGEMGGLALAEVIFGDVNPSGKMPVSAPRDVGTAPAFYNWLKASRPGWPGAGQILDNGTLIFDHYYVLDSPVPLWSFGDGLSYTTFKYSNLRLSKTKLKASDTLTVTVSVSNTGSRDGKEVVQAYVTDQVASVVTANQNLEGFKKVNIPLGKTVDVSISIPIQQLQVWNLANKFVVEPGVFDIKIGSSSAAVLQGNFTVT
ncbi:glycoside hydrolase family 3 protein [Tulasnella calospora MUT 4182]|uniref:Glycoside hydrolase family 3 protein n=1 Tax=Tulasnella calospora MUT 4182 TaxID=1051891 RepID=A0A0C3KJT9_9AGAM|nr:glycoside hydrolase family 3 protein [Tulasnella calospora MUT 4182]